MQPSEPLSPERHVALWFGALLLDRGHRVSVPAGTARVHVHTQKRVRKISFLVLDAPASRETGRTPIGTVADVEAEKADAIVLVGEASRAISEICVVPTKSTKEHWLNEGRHYALEAQHLVTFDKLSEWLLQSGRPE
jgi:hypothetical protein